MYETETKKLFDNSSKISLANQPKMYSVVVSIFSEYKASTKHMNKNVVSKISHNKYKDVPLNTVCLRYSMNRNQSKNFIVYKLK